ncbi:MAG: Holliday junction resolvase Hjc [Candidatus Pacearchaeota archaeon]
MAAKIKGANAERELFHLLWRRGFAVARVAGSGSTSKPACDLIAGNKQRKLAIEVKVCNNEAKYISKAQIDQLLSFSKIFGLEPLIAIKFLRRGWYFFNIGSLIKKEKEYLARIEYGLRFE